MDPAACLMLASDLLDDGEFLEVMPMAIDDVRRYITDGRITDVKVVTGLACLQWFSR